MIQLSKRLQAVADSVTKGTIVADIGTDHGYIPIYLVSEHICDMAYAMDVRKGPLERAKANVDKMGLSDKIEVRLSDGLKKLKVGEANSIVISGMGGYLITEILDARKDILENVKELILSPHSDACVVRHYLHNNNFKIVSEHMLMEEGKFYTIIKAQQGQEEYDKEVFYKYGKELLYNKEETLKKFLQIEIKKYENVKAILEKNNNEAQKKRMLEVEEILKYMNEGMTFFDK